jgi:hypothetical protein
VLPFLLFAAVDLGREDVRVAINTITDPAKLVANSKNKVSTPSSPRALRSVGSPSTSEIKIGEDAIRILKSRPCAGTAFLPRVIG